MERPYNITICVSVYIDEQIERWISLHRDRLMGRQTRKTDGQTVKQRDKQTDEQRDRQRKHKDRYSKRPAGTLTNWPVDRSTEGYQRQADRQTLLIDRGTEEQTER